MKADFDAKDLAKELTVTVEIKRYNQWLVRLWIAKKLIRLAGFIAWVDVEFVENTVYCGRCGEEINKKDAEVCWWCTNWLCVECWDEYGHCGHEQAEKMNEEARKVNQQPYRKEKNGS